MMKFFFILNIIYIYFFYNSVLYVWSPQWLAADIMLTTTIQHSLCMKIVVLCQWNKRVLFLCSRYRHEMILYDNKLFMFGGGLANAVYPLDKVISICFFKEKYYWVTRWSFLHSKQFQLLRIAQIINQRGEIFCARHTWENYQFRSFNYLLWGVGDSFCRFQFSAWKLWNGKKWKLKVTHSHTPLLTPAKVDNYAKYTCLIFILWLSLFLDNLFRWSSQTD